MQVLVEKLKHAIDEKIIGVIVVYAVRLLFNGANVDTVAFKSSLYEDLCHVTAPQTGGIENDHHIDLIPFKVCEHFLQTFAFDGQFFFVHLGTTDAFVLVDLNQFNFVLRAIPHDFIPLIRETVSVADLALG